MPRCFFMEVGSPAASNGVCDPRYSRQIVVSTRLLGTLLAGINDR